MVLFMSLYSHVVHAKVAYGSLKLLLIKASLIYPAPYTGE
jgi:hypothetical protein